MWKQKGKMKLFGLHHLVMGTICNWVMYAVLMRCESCCLAAKKFCDKVREITIETSKLTRCVKI